MYTQYCVPWCQVAAGGSDTPSGCGVDPMLLSRFFAQCRPLEGRAASSCRGVSLGSERSHRLLVHNNSGCPRDLLPSPDSPPHATLLPTACVASPHRRFLGYNQTYLSASTAADARLLKVAGKFGGFNLRAERTARAVRSKAGLSLSPKKLGLAHHKKPGL